jgi:bifunctional non-homologous end joining protein LigD
LKSWAVPKGPSLEPGEKRLAVEVEDHPVDYASFEGRIPAGQYGAGKVVVWDRGTWSPVGDAAQGLSNGRLRFNLEGRRLRGQWTLVRMERPRRGGESRRAQWLLTKSKDEKSQETDGGSGRRARMLRHVEPELATLVDEPPRDAGWWFEVKVDGFRAIAYVENGRARIESRGGADWTERYPQITNALSKLHVKTTVLDGEICFLSDDGSTNFQRLQNALRDGDASKLGYVVFDLLYLDGQDLRHRPLFERKAALRKVISDAKPPIHLSEHTEGSGDRLFREACQRGREGIIGKRSDAPYSSGRSKAWVKVKCSKRDEFVIVGFTPPKGKRTGLGAIVVATRPPGGARLSFAGKVGTGFDQATLHDLESRLRPLARTSPPVSVPRGVVAAGTITWVRPSLVCDVEFSEWTEDRRLRHPVFVGLREDKPADEVAEERVVRRSSVEPSPNSVHGVSFTHADRVVDVSSGTTKGQLAAYYGLVAHRILEYSRRRPLALVRCPEGVDAGCFFQKHAPQGLHDDVHRNRVGKHDVLTLDSPAGILSLVQFGVIELHGWGSRLPEWQKPDWIVFDLDPDEGLPFSKVVDAAKIVRRILERQQLRAFVKTTGGKGLHVVVPLVPSIPFAGVREFARGIAEALVERHPSEFVATASKRERRGKIFVDYLRNGEGTTAVLPFSVRAKPNLPVAMPVAWEGLADIDPAEFNVLTLPPLLEKQKKDPWAELSATKQRLPDDSGSLSSPVNRDDSAGATRPARSPRTGPATRTVHVNRTEAARAGSLRDGADRMTRRRVVRRTLR